MSITRLEKFLINRNLSKPFERNYQRYHFGSYIKFTNEFTFKQNAIYMAFDWSNTPEGNDFWFDVSAEWKVCLRNNML